MKRSRKGELSTRSLSEARWAPVIDEEREKAWAYARSRMEVSIHHARFRDGYNDARYSALGDHIYFDGRRQKQGAAS